MQSFRLPWFVRLVLRQCWLLFHLLFSIYQFGSHFLQVIESYIISLGLLQSYQNLQLHNLRHLAIVVDSEEARNTLMVKELLHWVSKIGVNYLTLYDMEGVLKKSLDGDLSNFASGMTSASQQNRMIIELLSFADSKAGVAKAASFLCSKYQNDELASSSKKEPALTESEIDDALNAVGCGGPDPDLLLIYGPVRCHLGFPAWRIRYTEIIHMGSLKSMKYGAILKAFYEYSKKQQNYGN
ncbi:hypothetical protein KSP40_PGU007434 [Platanthera guangdongensis]|uniref:ditrans,polycis-polyprenyl diphosphate synthase [(2E,6E)-farnesyldiphosphate specific] n=1 Tax=Platanthera guangdongensis TaxID=2320717 RepID=A0ABR2LL53_9ASPA